MTFHLHVPQCVKLTLWLEEHDKTCPFVYRAVQGAVAGRLTYSFTPNALFRTDKVQCACGAEIDLTDYESI